ncbi:uncharacterized protein LOC128273602 [Anopheles cruzii]|uniref:uncharacterized protein LOC128273602 n=1 Tax=Anopheles cruzii TaxID=68878 RepID=UPI0022EC3F64|nr:uncharacterized protein LOC128273602 [Anopheles cruzii]
MLLLLACLFVTGTAGYTRLGHGSDLSPDQAIHGCPRNSPSLNRCIEKSIQYYISYLYTGDLSELSGPGSRTMVPALDPFALPDATLVQNEDIRTSFTKRHTTGFRNMYITDVRTDITRLEFHFQFHISAIDTRGSYHARLTHHPEIAEWSQMTYSIRNSSFRMQLKGSNVEDDERVYLRVNVTQWEHHIGDHTVGFRWFTMSGNYSQHSDRFEQVRGRDILPVVERELMGSLQDRFQHLLNEILRLAPFERFFPTQY